MKDFYCDCGNRVYFESDLCLSCNRLLGFDTEHLRMVSLTSVADGGFETSDGERFLRCANAKTYGNCNWLLPADDSEALCASCRLNALIPDLERPGNLKLWARVEQAKRRLLYSLLKLHLPFDGREGRPRLTFRIMEDQRRNEAVFETFVATAHVGGTITVNILEADDAARHAVREQMQERYRTVLGHLRHESGHFLFAYLVGTQEMLAACRALFGDEREDYSAALETHYERGAPPDWPERYVSAYASAHPAEDFAETFAHFLHIDDALETAHIAGLAPGRTSQQDGWLEEWIGLAITLNEVLRSLGADDPYPFVLTEPVKDKLLFMSRLVHRPVGLMDDSSAGPEGA